MVLKVSITRLASNLSSETVKNIINIRDDGDRCSSSVGRVTEKDLDGTDYFENGQSVYLGKGCWGHET